MWFGAAYVQRAPPEGITTPPVFEHGNDCRVRRESIGAFRCRLRTWVQYDRPAAYPARVLVQVRCRVLELVLVHHRGHHDTGLHRITGRRSGRISGVIQEPPADERIVWREDRLSHRASCRRRDGCSCLDSVHRPKIHVVAGAVKMCEQGDTTEDQRDDHANLGGEASCFLTFASASHGRHPVLWCFGAKRRARTSGGALEHRHLRQIRIAFPFAAWFLLHRHLIAPSCRRSASIQWTHGRSSHPVANCC